MGPCCRGKACVALLRMRWSLAHWGRREQLTDKADTKSGTCGVADRSEFARDRDLED